MKRFSSTIAVVSVLLAMCPEVPAAQSQEVSQEDQLDLEELRRRVDVLAEELRAEVRVRAAGPEGAMPV